jgi:hypothetical protein
MGRPGVSGAGKIAKGARRRMPRSPWAGSRRAPTPALMTICVALAAALLLPAVASASGRIRDAIYCERGNVHCQDVFGNDTSIVPAPRGYDYALGCRWVDEGYSQSLGVDKHFCYAAPPPLPTLTRAGALHYAIAALRRRFKSAFYRDGFVGTCKQRISRTRRRCQVGWYQGDFSFGGHAVIWYSVSAGAVWWNYAYNIKRIDTYCLQVMHGSLSTCTRRYVVH